MLSSNHAGWTVAHCTDRKSYQQLRFSILLSPSGSSLLRVKKSTITNNATFGLFVPEFMQVWHSLQVISAADLSAGQMTF